jgi:hypothetical protein
VSCRLPDGWPIKVPNAAGNTQDGDTPADNVSQANDASAAPPELSFKEASRLEEGRNPQQGGVPAGNVNPVVDTGTASGSMDITDAPRSAEGCFFSARAEGTQAASPDDNHQTGVFVEPLGVLGSTTGPTLPVGIPPRWEFRPSSNMEASVSNDSSSWVTESEITSDDGASTVRKRRKRAAGP